MPTNRIRSSMSVVLHIAVKELRLQVSYRNKFLTDLFSHLIGIAPILLITFGLSGSAFSLGSLTQDTLQNVLFVVLGFTALIAFGFGTPVMQYTGMAHGITEEVNSGTIERNFLAPVSRSLFLLGIGAYYIVLYLFHALSLIVIVVVVVHDSLVLTTTALLTASSALFGLLFLSVGLGFAAAGFFLFTRDQSLFITVVHRPFMLFSGAVFLIDVLPAPIEFIARMNPLTYGIDLFRGALGGRPTLLSAGHELLILYLGGLATLAAGLILYRCSIRRQLQTGELARY